MLTKQPGQTISGNCEHFPGQPFLFLPTRAPRTAPPQDQSAHTPLRTPRWLRETKQSGLCPRIQAQDVVTLSPKCLYPHLPSSPAFFTEFRLWKALVQSEGKPRVNCTSAPGLWLAFCCHAEGRTLQLYWQYLFIS